MKRIGICIGIIGLLLLNGCTATSSPGMSEAKYYGESFKVDADDKVNVIVDKSKDVDIKNEGKQRLAQLIKQDIDLLKKYNNRNGKSNKYLVKVYITKYDKGNAFARFMLAGAGQIHVDGTVIVYALPSKSKIEEFNITKTFAWGGIYGGTTSIKEVAEGFAMGAAETITDQKKK